jgi:glycosyltransferase involved in cell wall biosynthesis
VNLRSTTGPNSFAKRLATELIKLGHQVETDDGRNSDVSIVFIEPSGKPLAKKIIQRLDGIWFKPGDFETKNVYIKNLYERADAVVWQSEFDKNMTVKWWGPKKGQVIKNGIDTSLNNDVVIPQLEQIRQKYEMLFVCSANWHPQKRLLSNINAYKHLKNFYSSSALLVLGSNPTIINEPDMFYTGPQNHEVCLKIFSTVDWMLHLAWLDHCPNTVVESLSKNTPVICSNQGGTKELVQEFGITLEEKKYDYELVDYDNPPDIDITSLRKLPEKNQLGPSYDVSIENCVSQYLKMIENI